MGLVLTFRSAYCTHCGVSGLLLRPTMEDTKEASERDIRPEESGSDRGVDRMDVLYEVCRWNRNSNPYKTKNEEGRAGACVKSHKFTTRLTSWSKSMSIYTSLFSQHDRLVLHKAFPLQLHACYPKEAIHI